MREHIWIHFKGQWSIRSTHLGGFITWYDKIDKLWKLDLFNQVDDEFYLIWQGQSEETANQIRIALVNEINRLELNETSAIFDLDAWLYSIIEQDSRIILQAYV